MRSKATAYAALQGPFGVEQHRSGGGDFRGLIPVPLMRGQGRGGQIWRFLIAQGVVAGGIGIFAKRPHQPQQIVAAAGTHTLVTLRMRVPPVHHVPLQILMAAAQKYLLPGIGRVDEHEVHAVLKLVPETKGAAALIQTAAPFKTAGQTLVDRPMAHIVIQRRAWGAQ